MHKQFCRRLQLSLGAPLHVHNTPVGSIQRLPSHAEHEMIADVPTLFAQQFEEKSCNAETRLNLGESCNLKKDKSDDFCTQLFFSSTPFERIIPSGGPFSNTTVA